jgi:hypothetical protein
MRAPAVVDIILFRPVELDGFWVGEFQRVGPRGYEVREQCVVFLDWYRAGPVFDFSLGGDSAEDAEGGGSEAETVGDMLFW